MLMLLVGRASRRRSRRQRPPPLLLWCPRRPCRARTHEHILCRPTGAAGRERRDGHGCGPARGRGGRWTAKPRRHLRGACSARPSQLFAATQPRPMRRSPHRQRLWQQPCWCPRQQQRWRRWQRRNQGLPRPRQHQQRCELRPPSGPCLPSSLLHQAACRHHEWRCHDKHLRSQRSGSVDTTSCPVQRPSLSGGRCPWPASGPAACKLHFGGAHRCDAAHCDPDAAVALQPPHRCKHREIRSCSRLRDP
mmetsp:Transcript_80397/g.208943  ORF Transcript_80397/g.208943 Transcript_80397/m.208943 type:complete len:249 (+) Transcript_80397:1756-2502(+)